jgi:hypothetical protein
MLVVLETQGLTSAGDPEPVNCDVPVVRQRHRVPVIVGKAFTITVALPEKPMLPPASLAAVNVYIVVPTPGDTFTVYGLESIPETDTGVVPSK